MPEPIQQPALFTHRNHYLFSDYYLDRRAGEQQEWRDVDAGLAFTAIKALWRQFKPQGDNEAQTEADWVRPVLTALGHSFSVQVSLKTPVGTKTPDYVFFSDEPARQAAKRGVLTEADFQGALAVGDAKAWERSLDRAAREVKTLHENPSLQIDTYIRHSGLAWGILTNGQFWRLYHKDTSKKLDVYYEVDLPALIEQGDAEAFKYFWLFFRREAFIGDAAGPTWLDLVLAESQAYEQGVSENLKAQVYDALRHLGQGFLDFPYNGLQPTTETLKQIHDNSLIVLYRLLFMLYAEARDLLPVRENRLYAEGYSLEALKSHIASDLDDGKPAAASMSGLWQQLYEQWHVIDAGDAALGVPAYNGGLFRPDRHPFIERYRVGDLHLREAIDLLTRAVDPATGHREFVDYRDLEIRHLGSIYEGLLEYQLRCAAEPLVIIRQKGKERYEPAAGVDPDVPTGQVYLVTDKGERKATGSYYTPDYIVQYIVEQTVGPVLAERTARFRKADGKITDEAGLAQAILEINCLDPAMGSGHFLVAAAEYIARYVVGLGLAIDEGRKAKDEAARSSAEPELAYWRRRVAQACIYGVDLNPLAVELAKLSLWLATVSKDKPLSFLDHHLRCGNSLIGARVADLPLGLAPSGQVAKERKAAYKAQEAARKKEEAARAAGQITMLDDSAFAGAMHTASGMMRLIEDLGSETLADVHRAEEVYRDSVRAVTEKARLLGDVWTARHFGLALDETLWGGLSRYLLHGGFEMPAYRPLIDQARTIADARRFFHWELEFPEVFFDEHGRLIENGGFDAMISNPPYIDIKGLETGLVRYLLGAFSTMHLRINVFAAFLEEAKSITSSTGAFGFVIPTAFLTQVSYAHLRQIILSDCWIRGIVRLPNELFGAAAGEVKVDTCVVAVRKTKPPLDVLTEVLIYDSFERVQSLSRESANAVLDVEQKSWLEHDEATITLTTAEDARLIERINAHAINLEDFCDFSLGITPYDKYSGHTPEQIEGQVFHAKTQLGSDYKRLLRSGDVRRYEVTWNGEDWIRYGDWLAAPREQRFFTEERILVQQIIDWSSLRIFATLTNEELYNTQNQFNLLAREGTSLRFLLAVVASRLMSYYHRRVFLDIALQRFQKILIKDARRLPIRRISFTTPAETRAALAAEAQGLAAAAVTTGDFAAVLAFVAAQLAAQPERSDVIHDLLAGLAEQMIAMNKQKGDEMRGFLAWLARETGAKIDDLTGKSRLRDYLGDYQKDAAPLPFNDPSAGSGPSLLTILRKNARKLAVDPGGRKFQESLKKEYEVSLAVLLPLKARQAATDRLIDQVVYRLYGLTEEEIAVVEGSEDKIQTPRMG